MYRFFIVSQSRFRCFVDPFLCIFSFLCFLRKYGDDVLKLIFLLDVVVEEVGVLKLFFFLLWYFHVVMSFSDHLFFIVFVVRCYLKVMLLALLC